jgi:thiaminase
MEQVPADISAAFQRRLDQAQVRANQRPDYHKWVRFYSLKEAKSPLDCM